MKIRCFTTLAAVYLSVAVSCMNGSESNSGEPVVTTPSASSSANSPASSASPATNSNLSIIDSSYNSDTTRIDTIGK